MPDIKEEAPQQTTQQGRQEQQGDKDESTLSWMRETTREAPGGVKAAVGTLAAALVFGGYGLSRINASPEESPDNPAATAPAEPNPTPEATQGQVAPAPTNQPTVPETTPQEYVLGGTVERPETTEEWLSLWEEEEPLVNGWTIEETSGHEFVNDVISDWTSDLSAIEHAESEAEASNFTERQLLTGVSFIIDTWEGFRVVQNPIVYGVGTNAEGGGETYSKRANHEESDYQMFSLLYMNEDGKWEHFIINQDSAGLFTEDGAKLVGMFMQPGQGQMAITPTEILTNTVQDGADRFIAKDVSSSADAPNKPYAVKPRPEINGIENVFSAMESEGWEPVSMVDTFPANAGINKKQIN